MNTLEILDNIKDERQRQQVKNILQSNVTHFVKCMSDKCKGRIVAEIDNNGKINPTVDKDGKMYLRAIRPRLDGYYGFQCWCGNDSRLCTAEKGVKGIEHNSVTKNDIEQVYKGLQKKPVSYPEKNGIQDIDNFRIEKIK